MLAWENLTEEEVDRVCACANKSEMWRVPAAILGEYCLLDAEATWLFWEEHLSGLFNKFNVYEEFHRRDLMNLERLLIAQMLMGIKINEKSLNLFRDRLLGEVAATRAAFLSYPEVQAGVNFLNQQVLEEDAKPEPCFKKGPKCRPEPPKYKKNGDVSSHWLSWEENEKKVAAYEANPEPTQQYKAWTERRVRRLQLMEDFANASETDCAELKLFNLGSPEQKRTLFYDVLKYEVKVWTKPEPGKEPQPSTDSDAMQGFGEAGKLYLEYADKSKTLQMVCSMLANCISHPKEGAWGDKEEGELWYHPQVKVPGTLTGRLGGAGGVNCQNPVKDKDYLSCWLGRDQLVDYDFSALEPVVLTELSRDASMLKLYGPGAKANDVYLFSGMAFPGIREQFAACGYNPEDPTPEAIKRCKKEHKGLRQVCKIAELSAKYGAGAKKWQASFAMSGFTYSFQQCKTMHQSYWTLYGGIKKFEQHLVNMWEKNGGWVLNGIGRPVCVDKSYIKDIVNRCVQSTGHDILMIWLTILVEQLLREGLRFRPWLADFHDEAIFDAHPEDAECISQIMGKDSFAKLNEVCCKDSLVKLKGEGGFIHSLADAKCEE